MAISGLTRRLLGAGMIGAGAYGGLVGVAAKADAPENLEQARKRAELPHFLASLGLDAAVSLADDAAALLLFRQNWFRRRVKNYLPLLDNLISPGLLLGGSAVAGTLVGHHYMNFVQARQEVAAHDQELSLSQRMIPDPRLDAIQGFQKGGMAALQRAQMTGIASPAAGGIFWRMTHNPVADRLNQTITTPDEQKAHDPRIRALGYSWLGGLAGMALGMRGGIAKATLMGLVGGTVAGGYGIYTAHNPDFGQNLRAWGDIALGAAPTALLGGALYGSMFIKPLGIGKFMEAALTKTSQGFGWAGEQMTKGHAWVGDRIDTLRQANKEQGYVFADAARINLLSHRKRPFEAKSADDPDSWSAYLRKGLDIPLGIAHGANALWDDWVTKMFTETGNYTSRWEKSLGTGHILAIAPHQALVYAAGAGIIQNRRSKATTTMPSNRKRAA